MLGQSFYPNKANDNTPKNLEEACQMKAPLLGSPLHEEDNDIIMNFMYVL